MTLSIRNNAPEIRSFQLELQAEGLEFSGEAACDGGSFDEPGDGDSGVFANDAAPGLQTREARSTAVPLRAASRCGSW